MAYKLLEKKISETKKRVDMRVLLKPGMFGKQFEPYEVKIYVVSPTAFDNDLVELMLQEIIDNKAKWKNCKKKECTQTYALTILPRANAFISAPPKLVTITVSNSITEPKSEES